VIAARRRRTDPVASHRRRWLLAAVLICAAGNVCADWRRDYEFGQTAMEKGNWAEAEKLMRSAQAEEPGASLHKRFQGTRIQLYAPGHFAGMAAFRQGACSRALDYFKDASTHDIVSQVANLAAEEQEAQRSCGSQVAAAPPPEAPKPPQVVSAAPPKTPTTTGTDNTQRPVPPPEVKPTVVAETPAKPVPTPAPPPPPTATRLPPPAALRSILAAFLAGDYDGALRINDAGISDARSHALVLLVRAAAGFTNAELKGGDAALSARAERDVKSSRQLARIDPDPNLFSPKIRALIAKAR
jgi:outer membrane biosynthesis protein TonB